MKNVLTLSMIALVFVLMFGCSEFSDPVAPLTGSAKESASSPHELMKPPSDCDIPQWVVDPDESVVPLSWPVPQVSDIILGQSTVSARDGAMIPFTHSLPNADATTTVITGSFIIPPGALAADTTITVTLDAKNLAIRFAPQGLKFACETRLNCTITGLGPLSKDPPIHFCYDDEKGRLVEMASFNLRVDYAGGYIMLEGGWIPHFSRYAFIRW